MNEYPLLKESLLSFTIQIPYQEAMEELRSDLAQTSNSVDYSIALKTELEELLSTSDNTDIYTLIDLFGGGNFTTPRGLRGDADSNFNWERKLFQKIYFDLYHDKPDFKPELLTYVDSETGEIKSETPDESGEDTTEENTDITKL
jgi:hypothetical protein